MNNSEHEYLKYPTGRYYISERRTGQLPFMRGDILKHKSLPSRGAFYGYQQEGRDKILASIMTDEGIKIADTVSNWEIQAHK